jgi:hypothetical protein
MRIFFEWLEEKFGGSLPMQSYDNQVITRSDGTLRYGDLCALFHHEITVLKVSNYYPRTTAIELGKHLAKQAIDNNNTSSIHETGGTTLKNWKVSTAKGLESSDVFTLGAHLPYNIAFNNPESLVEEYYKKVPIEFKRRRQRQQQHDNDNASTTVASPLWPLDQLRLELDEIWKHNGAGLVHTEDGYCRGGGLPRIMIGPTRWKKGFVHVDEMAPLSIKEGLFSANIYLQLPDKRNCDENNNVISDGVDTGDNVLEIWPLNIRNRWDWYRVSGTQKDMSVGWKQIYDTF